jgi:hypothetical protein
MIEKKVNTFNATIYLSGDINNIKQTCREFCLEVGLCVTIKKTTFIYTGGEELGVEIGLLNYPRFKESNSEILRKAKELANKCRDSAAQHSWLIVTPKETIWNSTRQQ